MYCMYYSYNTIPNQTIHIQYILMTLYIFSKHDLTQHTPWVTAVEPQLEPVD